MALRDIKRAARRDLHSAMQIPAFYIRTSNATPVLIHVRLFDKFNQSGDIKGSRTYPGEITNESPKLVFDLSEITPKNNAIVSIEAGEAYRIDSTIPPDDQFQTAAVIKLTATQAGGLAFPPPGTL